MEINKEELRALKLLTGEEVVGEVTNQTGDYITVKAPLGVAPTPDGLQLVPMMFSSDMEGEVEINSSKVIAIAKVRADMAEAYDKSLNPSNIVTPNKQIIHG